MDEWPYEWEIGAYRCWQKTELTEIADGKDGPKRDKDIEFATCPRNGKDGDEGCVAIF